MILYMYIVPGQGLTTLGDKILMQTGPSCHYGNLLQVLKKISLKSDFIHFFHDFIHVYSPRAALGLTIPLGWNFDANRNSLLLWSCVISFKKISLKSNFIHFFHDFIHVNSPGGEADRSQGTKFCCQQKCLVTSFICCKFQKKMSLKSDFL